MKKRDPRIKYMTREQFAAMHAEKTGKPNPLEKKALRDKVKELRKELADGKHDSMLRTCQLTGYKGDVIPAIVDIGMYGNKTERRRVLVDSAIEVGSVVDGVGKILSIDTDRMRAELRPVTLGKSVIPAVQVYRVAE